MQLGMGRSRGCVSPQCSRRHRLAALAEPHGPGRTRTFGLRGYATTRSCGFFRCAKRAPRLFYYYLIKII